MSSAQNPADQIDLLRSVTDYAADYLARSITRPVSVAASTGELRAALGGPLPAAGTDAAAALRALIGAGEPGLMSSASGRFFGFVMGGAYPVAVATEWLMSVWDQCAALYATSPTASVAEEASVGWLCQLFGLPASVSAGITSGCATANLTGLAAARHHVLAAAGWDVEEQGLIGAPAPRVLVSEGCHVTVLRALRLLGLGGQVRLIATDAQGRMRFDALSEAVGAGTGPLIVCGQVGNVDTGAVDPLPEVCDLVHGHGGWVHVDAAFGMWAAASPRLRARVAGLELADSWATDAHKWLNVPYDCGIALCAHPDSHRAALRTHAEYLTTAPSDERDPVDYTPEMSRRARALVLWTTLRYLGRDGVAELVERCCALARRLAARLAVADGITVLNDVVLNQVLVRFDAPAGREPAGHTTAIVAALQDGGLAWASPTVWRGEPTLRLSVCNWQTDEAAIDACAEAIVRCHEQAGRRRDLVLEESK